jgi:transcriptional regulator with PAS, ATPase and Fis domain
LAAILEVSTIYYLRDIQGTVQQTAEAIRDVLKIEVEVVDVDMVRIASTGQSEGQCGQIMMEGFVYRHVLKTGQTVVVENPGHHELCQPCPRKGRCSEDAEIAAPIVVENKPIGVIGLVSFNPDQTSHLLENKDWLLRFIEKMAELIASTISTSAAADEAATPALNLDNMERETIIKALAGVTGLARSKEKAAELLGISRATLYRKIKEYKIED